MKTLNLKKLHVWVILIGIIVNLVPVLHTHMWFDEAYSYALANHSFASIWDIDIHDVHPVFYYDCLHVVFLLCGHSVLAARLFSYVLLCLNGLLGFTHIRKDYGEKAGLLYSLLVFILPCNVIYGGEMRMYMLAELEVVLCAFYAMRIERKQAKLTDRIFFVIAAVLGAYTHYYCLLAAAVINLFLLLHWLVRKDGKELLVWLVTGLIQIGAYLPWLFVLFRQTSAVQQNFWLTWHGIWSVIEIVLFPFTGNLEKAVYVPLWTGILPLLVILWNLVSEKHKKEAFLKETHLYTLGTYIMILVIAALASLVMHRLILYARYQLVAIACLILWYALTFSLKEKGKNLIVLIVSLCLCSGIALVSLCRMNYASSNNAPFAYLEENIQDGDTILVANTNHDPNSFIMASLYPDHPLIYWNEEKWDDESLKAYQAFNDHMEVLSSLDDLSVKGRVWVIYGDDDQHGTAWDHAYDAVCDQLGAEKEETKYFHTAYKDIEYTIGLVIAK